MRPQGTRVWRRNGRKARKGVPAGRRATHAVETTYGRRQKDRDQAEVFSAFCAQRREMAGAAA